MQRKISFAVAMLLAFAALVLPAAATVGSGRVKVFAVELQPEDPMPGGQFLALMNGTGATVDLGCWKVRSRKAVLRIVPPLRLKAGGVVLLSAPGAWLASEDRVVLVDRVGRQRDATPVLTDRASDDRVWYRDAAGTWRFGRTVLGKEVRAGHLVRSAQSAC